MDQAAKTAPLPRFDSAEALKLWISDRFAIDTDPERILRTSAEAIGRYLDVARVAYGELDEESASVHIPIDWTREGIESIVGRHPIYLDSWLTAQYRLGRPVAISDIHSGDLVEKEERLLERGANRAFIAVPLINNGKLAALFTAIEQRPREWTEEEILLVSQVAARMWSTLEQLRLTHRLKESEEQFRQLAENLPALCWVADHHGQIAWANHQWHEMFDGTTGAEGDPRELIHPDDLPAALAAMDAMRRKGEATEIQLRMRGRGGVYRPFLRKAVPVRDSTGAIVRWCGLQIDLSEKQAIDRRQALLRSFHDRTRETIDPVEILTSLSEMLTSHFGISHFLYCEAPDGNPARLRIFHARGSERLDHSEEAAPFREAFRFLAGGDPWVVSRVVDDNRALDRDPRDPVARVADMLGVRSGVNIPIVKEGKLVAVMAALHEEARSWNAEDVSLCEEVAERVWAGVSRARAETELRERERNQAFLIAWSDRMRGQPSPQSIVDTTLELLGRHLGITRATYSEGDPTGRVFTVLGEWRDGVGSNLGVQVSLGSVNATVDREWLSGDAVWYCDVEDDPRVDAVAADRYATRAIRAFISVPMREGHVRSILSVQSSEPRQWSDGEIQLVRDIAQRAAAVLERAWAEQALQERERNQAFVIDWSDRIRGENSADAIIRTTLQWLGKHLGVTRVTHAETDGSGRRFEVTGEWRGDVSSILGNRFALEEVGESVDREWSSDELICYHDVAADPRLEQRARERYLGADIRAFVSVPLVQDRQMRSALSVQHHAPRRWRSGEVQLIRDIAQRAWVALDRARALAALQERERSQTFLIEWSDRLRDESSPETILAETLERLGRHLGTARANYSEHDAATGSFHVLREWMAAGSAPVDEQYRPARCNGIYDVHMAGEIAIVTDALDDPRFDAATRDEYLEVDARAFLAIPLVSGGRVRAILSVQQGEPRNWLPGEVQLLRDVAERAWTVLERGRAEEALQARERMQALLVRWADSIRNEVNPHAILRRTLRQLGEHFAVSRASYAEVAPGGDVLRVLDDWTDGETSSSVGQAFPLGGHGEHGLADAGASALWRIDDAGSDARLPRRDRAILDALGVAAVLAVPMVRAGRVVAMLSLQQVAPRRWSPTEVEVMREVAERAMVALERATSELRLAESEAQLAAFLDNAPVVMHMKDAEGRYIRINSEFARSVRRPIEEVTGTHPDEIFAPEIATRIEELEQRARAGDVATAEIEMGDGDDAYSHALTVAFPIPGSGAAKTAGFTIDLTERRRAEAALARSREALFQAEKMSALGSLLAGVSHELNNPLSIVVAQAVMMERQSKGTEISVRAEKIRKAADRCARIVQTFLAMARQKRPERTAVDLNEVAIAAHELADYGLRADGIATVRELAPELPLIAADSDQLHQIIINLIVNAQQAMAEHGDADRTLTIRSGLGAERDTVFLELADTGPGISEEARRRIFEPFYTTKPQGQGTGVGLSFSQGLAEAHGGRLELLRSERGAHFRLTLPISAHLMTPTQAEAEDLPCAPSARRALVVDDEREIAESLADFLTLEGFDCEIALGGAAAQERLTDANYDLIVSDLRMPGIDGPQLHAWIAAERPDLIDRVAFSTGDTLGTSAATFLHSAKRPVLEKPFMPDGVRQFLEQMDLV